MRRVTIGKTVISGMLMGGNPFSGFSHQGEKRSREMLDYYTPERIKETLRSAEEAGISAFCGRTDDHIMGIIKDHWKEGGKIQWFAQVRQDKGDPDSWRGWLKKAIDCGAAATYLHGGETDFWFANGKLGNLHEALEIMRKGGVTAGFAGHKPEAHEWIRDNLDVDFQMCCHYNPTDRSKSPHHISVGEKWNEEDRGRMLEVIHTIERPVIHYKVFAGGNKPVVPAFELLGRVMRKTDAVCVGFFAKDDPQMIAKDVALFEKYVDSSA